MRPIRGTARLVVVALVLFGLSACRGDVADEGGAEVGNASADGHDLDHSDGSRLWEWDADTIPSLTVVVTVDGTGGYLLTVDAPGFTLTGADVFDHVPGEGHAHLYVDGDLITMIYGPQFRLPAFAPGTYELKVTLSTNDHLEYTYEGQIVAATSTLTVEDPPEVGGPAPTTSTTEPKPPSVQIRIEISDETISVDQPQVAVELGTTVTLTVISDASEEVHVHGYDHRMPLQPGQPATLEFIADIPGIFEIEIEGSHQLLIELKVG